MSPVFEALQRRYQDLVARAGVSPGEEFWENVRLFLEDARQAGKMVVDPGERALLRAYMRFLGILLYEHGETPPTVELLPPERSGWAESLPARPAERKFPAWFWVLTGAAIMAIIAGLIAVVGGPRGWFTPPPTVPPMTVSPSVIVLTLPVPTPTPMPHPTLTPTASPTPAGPPTFSGLTIALGILPTGEPILIGNEFDWNTRAIYALFDYAGMQEGLPWSVVWTRNAKEIARQDQFWDRGEKGRAWVVYFNPDGTVLPGGDYVVSLYVADQLQAQASFRIRYYVVRTPTPTP